MTSSVLRIDIIESRTDKLVNAMTVDVEDYFQVSAFESRVKREEWDQFPCRVERNMHRILELFDAHQTRATFFTLGWIAERYPNVIREAADAGHEIASHGFAHVRASEQTQEEFSQDVSRSKKLLEDVSGCSVRGFRAASFSIGRENMWALDTLQDAGYTYSSSIYPVHHDHYGMPEAPRFAFCHRENGLMEIPITTVSVMNQNLPCGGGGYFRLLPYLYTKWALGRVNRREGESSVFYFHPWEIDPEQPRFSNLTLKTRIRHYTNLGEMESRLTRLLQDFRWDRLDKVFLEPRTELQESVVPAM